MAPKQKYSISGRPVPCRLKRIGDRSSWTAVIIQALLLPVVALCAAAIILPVAIGLAITAQTPLPYNPTWTPNVVSLLPNVGGGVLDNIFPTTEKIFLVCEEAGLNNSEINIECIYKNNNISQASFTTVIDTRYEVVKNLPQGVPWNIPRLLADVKDSDCGIDKWRFTENSRPIDSIRADTHQFCNDNWDFWWVNTWGGLWNTIEHTFRLWFLFIAGYFVTVIAMNLFYWLPIFRNIKTKYQRIGVAPSKSQLKTLQPAWNRVLKQAGQTQNVERYTLNVMHNSKAKNDPEQPINAWAGKGGVISVSEEALTSISPRGLEGLLAHELGHQLSWHPILITIRRMLGWPIYWYIKTVTPAIKYIYIMRENVISRLPFLLGIIPNLILYIVELILRMVRLCAIVYMAIFLKFERWGEYSADKVAAKLGYGHALSQVLEKTDGGTSNTWGTWCRNQEDPMLGFFDANWIWEKHPPTVKRIKKLQNFYDEQGVEETNIMQ